MINPSLVPTDALENVNLGISVSDSADLAVLGLFPRHAELAIGEITRAVLVAGGQLTYGGRIRPSGMTQIMMSEVRRFGTSRRSLTLCLAWPEHRKLNLTELDQIDRQLGTWGRLIALDQSGKEIGWAADRGESGVAIGDTEERIASYSGMRRFLVGATHARVLVGGQLAGFQGSMPGLIEEAIFAVGMGQPLYLAGGFGGAAAAVARSLGIDGFEWFPERLPVGAEAPSVVAALEQLIDQAQTSGWSAAGSGLNADERRLLAASHRPGEIASLVVLGMARAFGSFGGASR